LKFLIIGDIVGRSGMNIIHNYLSKIVETEKIDFIIANGENATGGRGIKEKEMKELFNLGINVITMGNHLYYRKEARVLYETVERLLIPANITNIDGHGMNIQEKNEKKIAVINLIGEFGMGNNTEDYMSNPFTKAKELIEEAKSKNVDYIFVDFHAEATAEKISLVNYLKNDVTCVFGTHTHVQTSDEEILEPGVAYITDVGMTGPRNSVLGLKTELAIDRFLTKSRNRTYECSNNPGFLRSIIVETDDNTNRAIKITRYNID